MDRRCWARLRYTRDLVRELVVGGVKIRYQRSLLGVLWAFVNPLAYMLIFLLIRGALRIDIPNYPLFVLIGIITFNWFRNGVTLASSAVTRNGGLIKRPGFPSAVLPVTSVLTTLVDLLVATPLVAIFSILQGGSLSLAVLLLPVILTLQFTLILGLGCFVAVWNVTYRDVQHLLGVVMRLFFFLTPIFYEGKNFPPRIQVLYDLNPMVHLISAYRSILIMGELPEPWPLVAIALFSGVLAWWGFRFYMASRHRFAEEL